MRRRLLVPFAFPALGLAIVGCSGSRDLPSVPSPPPPGTVKEAPVEKVAMPPAALKKLKGGAARSAAKAGAGSAEAN
jgi:hypothetical protein